MYISHDSLKYDSETECEIQLFRLDSIIHYRLTLNSRGSYSIITRVSQGSVRDYNIANCDICHK